MSGPIVRKYGFPNFDKIFGARPLEHGVDEPESSEPAAEEASVTKAKKKPAAKSSKSAPKKS